MKHLKFFFACLLMTAFSIGQVWADTYFNDTFSDVGTGSSGSMLPRSGWEGTGTTAPQYNTGVRLGASSSGATLTKSAMTNIEGTKSLKVTIYVSRYNTNANTLTVTATNGTISSVTLAENVSEGSALTAGTLTIKPSANAGVTSTTAAATWTDAYKTEFTITGASSSTTIAFASSSRLILGPVKIEDAAVTPPSCTSEITITKADNPANGTFVIDNSGTVCIDEGNATVNVTATPAEHYHLATVVSAEGTIGDIEGNACQITNIGASTTISVTFAENTKYQVTWNVSGNEDTKTQVYEGEKPVFPATPAACDATSTTFIGWATAPWTGKLADLSEKTVYKSASAMPAVNAAVTYYAVFAKAGGSASELFTFAGGTKADLEGTEGVYATNADNSDYAASHAPYRIKFNGNGKYVTIEVASQPGKVTFGVKKIGGANTCAMKVQEADAADGEFTDVEELEIAGASNAELELETSQTFKSSTRAVKLYFVKGSGDNVGLGPISIEGVVSYSDYMTTCTAPAVETPTFSPAAGTYTSAQSVELSCATDGATIYYTTDGSTPDNTKTEYTSAISVGETMTIKAIAIKDEESSAVASATYTINLPLSTMDAIFAAATTAGSTATDVNITFGNWVVSGVSTNGKNVFVTDGTKGFFIFDNGGSMGFTVGDILSGTAACKVQLYNGAAELTTLSSSTEGLTVNTGGVITPVVKAISALSGINTGAPVIINNVQFDGTNLSDGANSIKPYNSLFAYDALTNGTYYNVTGIYMQYGATKEILPRSAADIEELSLADPEISYTPASATIEVGDAWSAPTFNNPHSVAITSYATNNDAVATVTDGGVISLAGGTGTATITASFEGDATYAAANATYIITVNPAGSTQNVVILAVYDTKYYAMSTNNASSAFTAIAVEYDGSQVTVNSAEDKAAIQWTKKTSGDNTTFQDADEKYMKSADGTSMSLQDAVCNWIWDEGGFYKIAGTTRTFFYQNGTGFKNFATSNFNKSGYSGKADVIVIDPANIVISSKVSAELAYDPTSDVITQGDAWSAPSLVNPHSVTITSYATDNDAVATVTDGGVIALAGGIGTAHITAHFDGDASYLEGDAEYTITVNAPAPVPSGTTYRKVTATGDITDGEYLIVYEGDATHDAYAFNGSLADVDQAKKGVAVTINEGVITGTTTIDAATFTIDVTAGTLRSASGWYIGRTENSNGMEKNETTEYVNTFAIDGGEAVITSSGGPTLRYNYASDQLRFRYYKSGQQAIQLYKKEAPAYTNVRTGLTPNHYYTICYPKAMTDIQGATLWSFAGKDANFAYLVQENAPFEAGKPYIMYATASTVQAVLSGDDAAAGSNNGLYGTLSPMDQDALNTAATAAGNDLYLVIGDELRRATGAGTGGNSLAAQRAYVVVAEITGGAPAPMPGRQVRSMGLPKDTPTAIDNAEASEKPVKKLINGNLFILRGEKMYNANGQVVK